MLSNRSKVNLQPRHFIFIFAVSVLVLLVAYALRLLATAGRVSPSATLASRPASNQEKLRLAAPQPILPLCPNTTTPILRPSSQTGHHRVILTWKASPTSPNSNQQAAGYCLYRSTTPNPANEKPSCRDCEWINKRAIAGTACVDDLVQDGALYYYVVEAISLGGTTSSFSNQAPAQIPSTPNGSVTGNSYHLCRASNGSQ
jgi:hypothetical protein